MSFWVVYSGRDVAMPKPLLYQLHLHAVRQEERGTTVSQIMEPYLPQAVLFEYHLEMICHIVRLDKLPHRIDTDIFFIIAVIAHPEDTLHLGLALTLGYQLLLDYGYQRQDAVGGFGFHYIEALEVGAVLQDFMLDAYRPSAEIYCRPFQPYDLAPAQAVVRRDYNNDMERVIPCAFDKLSDLFGIVIVADELLGFGSVCLIHGIARNDTPFHR